MELVELTKKLEECQEALAEMGAYGTDLFDYGRRHGAMIAVQMKNRDLPKGEAVYDTSVYNDQVVKNVVVGGVAFFALLDMDEAYHEGVDVLDSWGALI